MTVSGGSGLVHPKQIRLHELDRGIELELDIFLLSESMTFVIGHEKPDGRIAAAHRFDTIDYSVTSSFRI